VYRVREVPGQPGSSAAPGPVAPNPAPNIE
jgi:hypothetical protein